MSLSRRHIIKRGAAFSLGFAGLHTFFRSSRTLASVLDDDAPRVFPVGYGPLLPDPKKILDLPAGFRYSIISRRGGIMSDGLFVPGQPDAMAAFPGPRPDTTIIVRNHELPPDLNKWSAFGEDLRLLSKVDPVRIYDIGGGKLPSCGGTTTILYNTKEQKIEKEFLSLAGTINNCAGGAMPWGAWLSCEEDVTNPDLLPETDSKFKPCEKMHGYCFEVPASAAIEVTIPRPIKAMGRFRHEACAMDPRTGVVYQTEDREDGLIYRYLPRNKTNLHEGGTLQALAVKDRPSLDTSNHKGDPTVLRSAKLAVRWIDLEEIDSPKDDLRRRGFANGAACFARNEGMWYGNEAVYFAATMGGFKQKGQLWKYIPSEFEGTAKESDAPGLLELFVEPDDGSIIENADNVTVSPWGDLIVCEDEVDPGDDINHLLGVTPDGEVYKFARNALSKTEFAGATFSPDGSTLFVNLQGSGVTLAITGPWRNSLPKA